MKKYFNIVSIISIKWIIALIIYLSIPFSFSKADQPTSPGTQVFKGYDIYSTTIVKEGNIWKQWFGGWLYSSDLPWDRIYYSYSTDSGSTWSAPQLAFTITDVQVNDPDVLRIWDSVNSRYYYIMYYTYYPSGLGNPTNYIAVSTSLDGINWSHHGVLIGADNGIDSDGAWSPSAYSVDSTGSTIYIYFHNNHPDGRIFRTTLSNNGLTFNDTTTIAVTDAGTFKANVDVSRSNDGRWWMFYNGSSLTSDNKGNFDVCKMYSNDGIRWTESAYNPIQMFTTMTTTTPFVVWTGDSTYQLWYGYGPTSFTGFSVYEQNFISQTEYALKIAASSEALPSMDASQAIDNNPSTFWSSAGHTSANNIEWLYLNLGVKSEISKVILTPRVAAGAPMCFPVNFKLQYSNDGSIWTDIYGQSYTNYSCTDTLGQEFVFDSSISAQYIRLYATKLSADSFGNYYCQIAEINATEVTSVKNGTSNLPNQYILSQNYPNPFNPSTQIKYSIPKSGIVTLKVYNMLGQEVATLINKEQKSGDYTVNFDASKLASGVYLYRIEANGFTLTKKMTLLK
ncbi:MAG: discoidin domain-containing protein [Ignavibacteriaceae bacterium]